MSKEYEQFLRHAQEDIMPKMKGSALSLTIINGDPDPKLCIEVGAAILYDKPLIVVIPEGQRVPANLKRVATAIIPFKDMADESTMAKIRDAITAALDNDARTRKTPV